MINIWDYKDAKELEITDIEGVVFQGLLHDMTDMEDQSPDYGPFEDSLALSLPDGRVIEFAQSEIAEIVVLD